MLVGNPYIRTKMFVKEYWVKGWRRRRNGMQNDAILQKG